MRQVNARVLSSTVSRREVIAVGAKALAATGVAGALAACGAPPEGEASRSGQAAAPVTIQYWDWAEVWRDLVGKLADGMRASRRNVTVQWDIPPGYWDKLQVAIAGDTAPDTWRMNGPNLPQWATLGLLEDVSSYFAKDKDATASLKAMAPVIVEYTRRGGKQWSMPFGQAISGIIAYNEDLIRSEGLAPPAELGSRWTWAMLQEYAVKLTRRDGSRHGYFVDKGLEIGWMPFGFANGGALFDKEGKRSVVNSPEMREMLEYMAELSVRQRVTPSAEDLAQENAEPRFLNGRLAMLPRGSWLIKDLNLKAKALKWDLVPVPLAPRTRKSGGTNQMASIAMSRSTKHKPPVWEWQKFTGSKEGQDTIARMEFFPARNDSAEQIYYKPELGPPHRPLLRDVLAVVQPYPFLDVAGNTSGYGPIVNPLINQMFDGQIGVREAVQQMHDQLTAGIERGFK